MKSNIYSNTFLIGTSDLKFGDLSMGCVYGEFIPNDNYFAFIQKSVWGFWAQKSVDFKKWNSLHLNIQLENGYFLFPQGGITIEDIQDLFNEPKRIDVLGLDPKLIQYLFSTDLITFKKNSWSELSISKKIAVELELTNEIGMHSNFFFKFFFNIIKLHSLFGSQYSAVFYDQSSDDVLFEIRKNNIKEKYVLVHLTWIGKKEKNGYPKTIFFQDFQDFEKYLLSEN